MLIDEASTAETADSGCAWWNLACKGGTEVANAGLSAITKSVAAGAEMLLSEIVDVVDQSSQVPLADPTYREVYAGFLGLALPVVGVILCVALVVACLRQDPGTLGRAVVGIGVAGLGGAFYIVFAQLLVAIDDWFADGVVRVTGHDLRGSVTELAAGFQEVAGNPGEVAANMLILLLMVIMLVAGLILWFILVLRKIAILVVVAFAPLLIAGYLWKPTRTWVRKATEVLIALVFTKTAIFTLFGVGLALITQGPGESLGNFVGATVLMCGACFTPFLMLRLVHFAGDTNLASDAMGALGGGMRPVAKHLPGVGGMGRHDMARTQGQGGQTGQSGGQPAIGPQPPEMGTPPPTPGTSGEASAAGAATGSGAASNTTGGTATTGAAAAGGTATAGATVAAQAAAAKAKDTADQVKSTGQQLAESASTPSARDPDDSAGPTQHGPTPPTTDQGGPQ